VTEEEWVREAIAAMPAMSDSKKNRLALIFSEGAREAREAELDPDQR
jgi:hypothetical protein